MDLALRPLPHHSPEQEATSEEGVTSVIYISDPLFGYSTVRALDTHLGRDVLVKVSGILRVSELWYEWRLHPMDIIPVDPFEPHVRLRSVNRSRMQAANDRSERIKHSTRAPSTRDTLPGNTASEHRSLSAFR